MKVQKSGKIYRRAAENDNSPAPCLYARQGAGLLRKYRIIKVVSWRMNFSSGALADLKVYWR